MCRAPTVCRKPEMGTGYKRKKIFLPLRILQCKVGNRMFEKCMRMFVKQYLKGINKIQTESQCQRARSHKIGLSHGGVTTL